MFRLWAFLRSPKLALGILVFLALYCVLAAWYPWQRPGAGAAPRWALALHLDRPFSSPAFLAGFGLLFLSTAACTWSRTRRVAALVGGRVGQQGVQLEMLPGRDVETFLRAQGFGQPDARGVSFRYRAALAGGWVLHLGLLALMLGIVVQQGFHDGGAFELAVGESLRLDAPNAIFARQRGPFAPGLPPALGVRLASFDPFLHQRGYAPDRASVVEVERSRGALLRAAIDRAAGVDAGGVTLFQAIPSGLAVVVEIEGLGARALHLREQTHTRLHGEFESPSGRPVELVVESERSTHDPAGTGHLAIWLGRADGRIPLSPGATFDFGGTPARLVEVVYWGGFTYTVDPGMPAVFSGFALLLVGAALMTLPAGVAERDPEVGARVHVARGREALLADWLAEGASGDSGGKVSAEKET